MLAGWVTRGRPIRLIINAQARPSTRSEEQFHVTGAIGDVYCIDGNRTVAEQREMPILFSERVRVPTATFHLTVSSSTDLELFHKVSGAGDHLFGVLWRGAQNQEGTGSLCRLTSIVSMEDPKRKLVSAEVVGRMVIDEFQNISPYPKAVVTPIMDGEMENSESVHVAEMELWQTFDAFMTAAGKLYNGCVCSWECYVGDGYEDDDYQDLEEADTRKSLIQWAPSTVAEEMPRHAQIELPEAVRCENFSFAAARALGLPNEDMQDLLACTSTLERIKIIKRALSECTNYISARSSIKTLFQS